MKLTARQGWLGRAVPALHHAGSRTGFAGQDLLAPGCSQSLEMQRGQQKELGKGKKSGDVKQELSPADELTYKCLGVERAGTESSAGGVLSAADGLKSSAAHTDRGNTGVRAGKELLPVEGGCTISTGIRQDGALSLLFLPGRVSHITPQPPGPASPSSCCSRSPGFPSGSSK